MRILGIETTTGRMIVAVWDGLKRRSGLYTLNAGTRHAELLPQTVSRVLSAMGLSLRDIDCFAAGIGPGSFTGIRIGLAAVKGYALGCGRPAAGVNSLEVLARAAQARGSAAGEMIVPVLDARRGLVYSSGYKVRAGKLSCLWPVCLSTPEELSARIKGPCVLCGDGLALYAEALVKGHKGVYALDKDYWYPEAFWFLECAKERAAAGETHSAAGIKALYVYPKDCQVRPHAKR
jgi:tRNA threonylcarbamoyladenosine biosynthesis protein TsaB